MRLVLMPNLKFKYWTDSYQEEAFFLTTLLHFGQPCYIFYKNKCLAEIIVFSDIWEIEARERKIIYSVIQNVKTYVLRK